ncbi:box C/D snoRNA protein 1-like isoform X2 [Pocillopora damicornis]|uniref:box C/D snoRNA protein 1-like isoform X2 n=1 Tax=Pocillopora damicornis TaxID=46731 RepID=UPI000F5563FC|nr:box C/D snoRNA protein 1-like isoform X2 [Pocillopora damicornis]
MADSLPNTKCAMCCEDTARYCCPTCAKKTCSLRCVKSHKMKFQCSGVRCKTKFISLDNFKCSNLQSDLVFLEDMDRLVNSTAHHSQSKFNRRHQNFQVRQLCLVAKQRGVNLKILPNGMSRRKENTTNFNRKEKCIKWRIQWLFPEVGVEYTDKCLKKYCEVGTQGVCVFLKNELVPGREIRYHQLDISQTLKSCLNKKTIIEFPTLHVVLHEKTASYPTGSQHIDDVCAV